MNELSEVAQAYLVEYGELPRNRQEQDRYNAFRFGFERGFVSGRRSMANDAMQFFAE